MRKIIPLFLIAASLLAGCLMVVPTAPGGRESPPAGAPGRAIGPFTNNSVVNLQPGVYRENLEVRANKVSFLGGGTDSTVIEGSVTIYGNSCLFRDLSIRGDVLILGNNNDLSGAAIRGKVTSRGNNNLW